MKASPASALPIEQAGYEIRARGRVSDPEFRHIDWSRLICVVVMGGPMGVYETDAHPWIAGEIAAIAPGSRPVARRSACASAAR